MAFCSSGVVTPSANPKTIDITVLLAVSARIAVADEKNFYTSESSL